MDELEVKLIEVGVIPNLRHSEPFTTICSALVEALPKIEAATKDAENPHLHSKYADLSAIMDVAKGPLAAVGIVIMQPPAVRGGNVVTVSTVLLHKSSQWMACDIELTAGDARPQTVGSAITYARRYGLQGLLGITAEDDDGNAASGVTPKQQRNTPAQQKQVAEKRIEEIRATVPTKPANFDVLKEFRAVKTDLKKITGSDGRYYEILGAAGFEHANQIGALETARKVYKELKQAFADAMAKATA